MNRAGFSIVEIFMTMLVIAALSAITVPTVSHFVAQGRKAREISAARKIIGAYLMYASDHDGELMPGYRPEEASDAQGNSVGFPVNARYPWRLAPYLDYDMHAILFNGNENALKDKVDFHYAASVSPNLGMNVSFVGGDYGDSSDLAPGPKANSYFGNFCVTRLGQAVQPAKLIVFASARRSETEVGYFKVQSPAFSSWRWSGKWDPKAPAWAFGFVDMRYSNHAVTAMLDGHVELLDEDQIKDMRRWSNQAAEQNNPRFTLQRSR